MTDIAQYQSLPHSRREQMRKQAGFARMLAELAALSDEMPETIMKILSNSTLPLWKLRGYYLAYGEWPSDEND